MTPNEFVETHSLAVKRKARSMAASNSGIVEADDVEQEIWLNLLEPDRLAKLVGQPSDYVERVIHVAADQYCIRERYSYTFHSAQYVYTPAEVRAFLESAFFDPSVHETVPTKDDGYSIESGGVCVPYWDIYEALNRLDDEDKKVVRMRYQFGLTLTEAERKRCNRAVDKITRSLNRFTSERGTADAA